MLCTWSPLYASVNSIINTIKTVYRADKYFLFEKPNEEFYYLNNFIKNLDLSPKTLKMIEMDLKPIHRNFNLRVESRLLRKDFNALIKRNFHSKVSNINDESQNVKQKIENIAKSDELKKLIEKYNLKPHIQLKLVESYQIGYERALKQLSNLTPKDTKNRYSFIGKIMIAAALYFIVTETMKGLSTKGLSSIFSKSWGDSGASLVHKVDVKFDDVQGCDEVKKELSDVVYFLKNPSAFTEVGAKLPKGVLLYGEPGLGKTLLARAVAGEAGVPFLHVSGSQFDEMFVGVGASRIRSLFNEAKEHSPCVIFIDELDAVCSERTNSNAHPHANQSINQLLAEMDGFLENEGIIVIGATNRAGMLDKAILRPGRFDLKIQVYPPDYKGRLALFNLYLSKVVINGNLDIPTLARSAIGYTGADIKNMVNQAAILCALNNDTAVTMSHLWESQTKISLGSARSRPLQEKDNILTAYHEAGHSIVNYFSPKSPNKVKVITIIPRGHSGGHNSFVPKVESGYQSKAEIMAVIDGLMGGRAAEELLNGIENISTGVSSDMKHATDLARRMVQTYSMSDEIGLQVFENKKCNCGSLSSSPKIAEMIDIEVNRILKESYEKAKAIIQEHKTEWQLLAKALLKYETLEGDDIELVINGKKPKAATIFEDLSVNHTNQPIIDGATRLFGLFSNKNAKK